MTNRKLFSKFLNRVPRFQTCERPRVARCPLALIKTSLKSAAVIN
jgi:hypothetical protein